MGLPDTAFWAQDSDEVEISEFARSVLGHREEMFVRREGLNI